MQRAIDVKYCNTIAKEAFDCNLNPKKKPYGRWFSAMFGVYPNIAVMAWNEMILFSFLVENHRFLHLLWTLNFLKVYGSLDVMASRVGTSNTTYQKWVKATIGSIVKIRVVS
jgi:hypothetical protein